MKFIVVFPGEELRNVAGVMTAGTVLSSQVSQSETGIFSASAAAHGVHRRTLQSGDFGDDLRRMNTERISLDEELREIENKEIKQFVDLQVCVGYSC